MEFIWDSVMELRAALGRVGGGLIVLHGRVRDEVRRLATLLHAQAVYTNHDYEPDAVERDLSAQHAPLEHGISALELYRRARWAEALQPDA